MHNISRLTMRAATFYSVPSWFWPQAFMHVTTAIPNHKSTSNDGAVARPAEITPTVTASPGGVIRRTAFDEKTMPPVGAGVCG